jgi:GntR family transcriptional regulator, transcriptional repressor for pyruvate dehydrogenase complex
MEDRPDPPRRQSLSDELAQRVRQLIREGGYQPGDRLPGIVRMARDFGVAHPTLREGLRTLEALGVVKIRHGAGVFVGRDANPLLVANPIFEGAASRRQLLDLVDARTAIELTCASLAARHATPAQLARMRQALKAAEAVLHDPADLVSEPNRGFHLEIARASGNGVLLQLLEALVNAMGQEQRIVNGTQALRERFHAEHLGILDALERRDAEDAVERMRTHLEGVRAALLLAGSPDTDRTS